MLSETEYTIGENEAAAIGAKTRAAQERIVYDDAALTCVIRGERFALADVPFTLRDTLALRGMAIILHRSYNTDAMLSAIKAGRLTVRGPKAPKQPSLWRRAIANALVESTKKSEAPLSADTAAEKAAALTRDQLVRAKADPLVVKHHAKLAGDGASAFLASLV